MAAAGSLFAATGSLAEALPGAFAEAFADVEVVRDEEERVGVRMGRVLWNAAGRGQ